MTTLLIDKANALTALLEREAALLRDRDITNFQELNEHKPTLISSFETALHSALEVGLSEREKQIVDKTIVLARSNLRQLSALRHGIHSLVERVSRQDGSTSVGAYGEHGQGLSFSAGRNQYLKKV